MPNMRRCCGSIFVFAILLCGLASLCRADFVHPGMLHSRAELEFVKIKVRSGAEPWKSAWDQMRLSKYAALDWKPRPEAKVIREAGRRGKLHGDDR